MKQENAAIDLENTVLPTEEREELLDDPAMLSHYFNVVDRCGELAGKYPDFDMAKEFANPEFVRLVGPVCMTDPELAYKVIHFDEILAAKMEEYAKESALRYANSIRAGLGRPKENGSESRDITPGYKSKEYREEVKRRLNAGEKVTPNKYIKGE